MRAVLRRRQLDRHEAPESAGRQVVGEIAIDRAARLVWRAGQEVELTHREFEILSALMERVGQAVPRAELFDRVWGEHWVGDPRTLDVHIRWLREKLEDDPSAPRYIQTVRGYGYRFVDPGAAPAGPA